MTASEILAANVQALRSERNLTRASLGAALRWSPEQTKALEDGNYDATLSDLDALAKFFDVSPLRLMQATATAEKADAA